MVAPPNKIDRIPGLVSVVIPAYNAAKSVARAIEHALNQTYSNIEIKVTDGKAEAALPTFAITVSQPVIGSATLSWAPPATNEDGSALTDLSGYVIRYGKTAGVLDQKIRLNSAGITTVVVENLIEGTWYFTMSSVNAAGIESRPTSYVSKTIS